VVAFAYGIAESRVGIIDDPHDPLGFRVSYMPTWMVHRGEGPVSGVNYLHGRISGYLEVVVVRVDAGHCVNRFYIAGYNLYG
jgi:hypothetical protein